MEMHELKNNAGKSPENNKKSAYHLAQEKKKKIEQQQNLQIDHIDDETITDTVTIDHSRA